MNIFFEIIRNFGMLISISIISSFIGSSDNKSTYNKILQGILFGSAAVIGMLSPVIISEGIIFDGRSVVISICAAFFGPVSGGIATLMPLVLRIYQGGAGMNMGILVIVSSMVIGLIFYDMQNKNNRIMTLKKLYLLGIVVHILMVIYMNALPAELILDTIRKMAFPVMLVYPIVTVLIGWVLIQATLRSRAKIELLENVKIIAESERRFKSIFESSADAILLYKEDKIFDCNQAAADLLGGGEKDYVLGKYPWEISPDKQDNSISSEQKAKKIIKECKEEGTVRFDWQYIDKNGKTLNVEIVITKISIHGEEVFHVLCRDMSEKKELQSKLEYMSYHDKLTGLYNRHFLEEEILRADTKDNYPLTILMADVNGLKLVNDSFGHFAGDELLKTVARVINEGNRKDGVAARVGGDEFIIVLKKTNEDEAKRIVDNIQRLAEKEKIEGIDISITFGWATKSTEGENIKNIQKKAEDFLYKKKLFESPSMRNRTIDTIIHTLHEKNKREEAHSHRVSIISEKIGKALNLSDSDVKELKNMGLLHDIGKIALDENVLNKTGKLTDEEWESIKKHPEIGYRILSTVNEMSEIAEYVLSHHEKWDGSGYPRGIAEEEIPLMARIITIADSFDAMTCERPYRQAMSYRDAIDEIKRCAGTQFDPFLADVFCKMMEADSGEI